MKNFPLLSIKNAYVQSKLEKREEKKRTMSTFAQLCFWKKCVDETLRNLG